MDSLIVHHQIFATPTDSIKLDKYCHGCTDSTDLYYALTPPIGYDGVYNFSAQLGDCQLNLPIGEYGINYFYNDNATFTYNPLVHDYIVYSNNDIDEIELQISCESCADYCTNFSIGAPFNPYAIGMLGDWRQLKNFVYYTYRTPYPYTYTSISTDHHTNIWENGTFAQFNPLWIESTHGWELNPYFDSNWTWTNQINKYDEKGNEIEDVNPLGNYSSALYGYLESVPTAVASDASFKEIGFDGFEDYGYSAFCGNQCANDHWNFNNSLLANKGRVTTKLAHTGMYSLKVPPSEEAFTIDSINYYNDSLYRPISNGQFILLEGGKLPLFSPDSGKYLISAWVNENQSCPNGYPHDSIVIETGPAIYSFHTSGPVIDGWQRFYGAFSVPGTAKTISVSLVAGGSDTAFYDDVRVQPFAGEMKTYVYDPTSMRLMATLDENNYATFYEYNDEGILIRVKKETEKGIMTIKESRSSYPRQ
jgi:hypothetical protein